MTKRSLLATAVLLGLSFTAGAQQIDHPLSFRSLHPESAYFTSLARDTGSIPFSTGFPWSVMTANDFLPNWRPAGWDSTSNLSFASMYPQSRQTRPVGSANPLSEDSSKEVVNLRTSFLENVHGEVGFFYGRSSGGRNSAETEGGYISAETGNDKVQIGVGASYENSNFSFKRGR